MTDNERNARDLLTSICETDEVLDDYDLDLVEEGFIDSFAVLDAIVRIEDETGVRLQATDLGKDNISSVNKLIAFLDGLK